MKKIGVANPIKDSDGNLGFEILFNEAVKRKKKLYLFKNNGSPSRYQYFLIDVIKK